MRIKKIFITHFHGDHFLGLPGLVQTLSFAGREEELHIYGPRGIKELVENILSLSRYDVDLEFGFDIITHELSDNFEVREKKYRIKSVKVEHYLPTYGLIFEEIKGRVFLPEKARALGISPSPLYSRLQRGESVTFKGREISPDQVLGEPKKGIKVVYSSDTRPNENVIRECRDAILIHDATFDESLKDKALETKHATCLEACEVAKKGGAKALYLIHVSPRYKKADEFHKQCSFEGAVVAKDLMRVEIS